MTIASWRIEFTQPLWFAVLAVLPLLFFYGRRSLVQVSSGRKVASLLLRSILLLLVAAALAGPRATGLATLPIVEAKSPVAAPHVPSTVELAAPARVRAGESFSLDLLVRAKSAGNATVELFRESQPLLHERISVREGDNHKSILAIVPNPSRVAYTVRVEADRGVLPDVNEAGCAIQIDPLPRVLLVESQPVLAKPLAAALTSERVEVEVRSPAELPNKLDELAGYELVILSNVPAAAMPVARMEALRAYVYDAGGGLIVVGGEQAFTAGGYRKSVLEAALPVISEPAKSKPKATLAMVLVLDISGSMDGRSIELAKEALRRAVGMLGPRDQVGVLIFEDTSRWLWPLGPATDKEKIIARIDSIKAEGSTNMYPPLEQAYLALRESYADLKHIIVMTDGVCTPGDFDGLARSIAAAGITMSTVGVGDEPVEAFLRGLAEKAKGRAYLCKDAAEVPRIFEIDTTVAAKIGITEGPFFPQVVHASQALRGLDISHAPTLLGYVETQARPEADVLLAAKTGEPTLATWRYGRGTAAAFTSDIQNHWATGWLHWPDFGRFWAQLVRQTMRREPAKPSRLSAEAANGRLQIVLDSIDGDGRFINGLQTVATIATPGGALQVAPLMQTAPGRYTALHPITARGTYWLDAQLRRDGKLIESLQCGTVVSRVPEAAAKIEGLLTAATRNGLRTIYLWPWLLGAATMVLVIDLAVKRMGRIVR